MEKKSPFGIYLHLPEVLLHRNVLPSVGACEGQGLTIDVAQTNLEPAGLFQCS